VTVGGNPGVVIFDVKQRPDVFSSCGVIGKHSVQFKNGPDVVITL
jgi:hypothetical protein